MTTEGTPPKPSRTPWIIAGVLGCLVVCLLIVVVGGGAYMLLGQPKPTAAIVVAPTQPPVVAQPTQPRVVAQPTQPPVVVQPTQPSVAAQPTQPPVPLPTPPAGVAQPQPPGASGSAPTQAAAPTGKIAFSKSIGDGPENQSTWIMNEDGSNARKILDRASHPAFSPDGSQIVYYHWTDGLYVAKADGSNPKKIVGDTFTGGNYGSPDWSHDGRLIAFSAQPGGSGNIVIDAVNADGSNRHNITVGEGPSWSPDDTQLVFHTCRGPQCGIFHANSGGGDAVPIITDDGGLADWSPDGKEILYQKDVDGQKQLFVINADGSGKKQLTQGSSLHVDGAWSSDGKYIFYRSPEGGTWAIWRMNADGTNPIKLIDNVVPVNWPYERLATTR